MKELFSLKVRLLTRHIEIPSLLAESWKKQSKELQKLTYNLVFKEGSNKTFFGYCYYQIYHRQSIFMLIHAKQGSGKTVFQYYLIEQLKIPDVRIYTLEQFQEAIRKIEDGTIHRYHVAIMDGTLLFPSRNFTSKEAKELQRQVAVLRAFENIYTISFPFPEDGDLSLRKNFDLVEINNHSDRWQAIYEDKERSFNLNIPEYDESTLAEWHEIDQKYKRGNLKY